MHRGLLSLILAIALTVGGGGGARAEEETDPGELARESIELMMRSLNLIIESIPQYEMPEINENGDIIIRRKRDTGKTEDEEQPDLEKTNT